MRLKPRLAEPFTGAVREGRDAVGRHTEDRGDLVRVHPLDLGVPEHRLPAVGQAAERTRRQGAVEGECCGIVEGVRIFEVCDVIHLGRPWI